MKKLYLLIALLLPAGATYAQGFAIDTVFFAFDSHTLKDDYKQQLDSLIGVFTTFPAYYVEIFGHTDSIGNDTYNLDLSRERARVIALYLREQGIDLERITYEGLGTTKPVTNNDTYAGRRMNRRADIAVVYSNEVVLPEYPEDSAAIAAAAAAAAAEAMIDRTITDTIYCNYNPFLLNPKHRTVVISPRGIKLTVQPETFLTDEPEITMEVKELFDRKQMILNTMPTVSKDGPLEAAGMMSFTARAGRRVAKIDKEKAFTIELPATRRDQDMAVYSGSGGGRGGARRSKAKKGRAVGDEGDPGFGAVKAWAPARGEEGNVKYRGRAKSYVFDVPKPGKYAVARPLWHSQDTDPEDIGMNIQVKLKGPRWEKTTSVMLVGEVVKTYIPFKKESRRLYLANKIKYLDPKTKLVLVAIQYDDRGNPWLVKRSFIPRDLLKQKKPKKNRKKKKTKDLDKIKIKAKFRKMTQERFDELLEELNV
ncbi:MAG: OmpA family protein [Bacteroidota bacterium]